MHFRGETSHMDTPRIDAIIRGTIYQFWEKLQMQSTIHINGSGITFSLHGTILDELQIESLACMCAVHHQYANMRI